MNLATIRKLDYLLISSNEKYQWHLCLGHISLDRIQRLVSDRPLSSLVREPLPACKFYLEGKITKIAFNAKGNRATKSLELIHSNVCGHMNI